ncbi:MOSC domain-containing protein [Glycomyces terrestris]|uniref:MOSC domain-containing protein n=1 Tax=Glycomyces terrestris TaxID=2493553 RepID=UPI001315A68F|nr:MOSC N-terminal beta barrel domain-containing protein [Glycomyces terrestris]
MFAGEIRQLWRYPVKGLRGESLRSAVVESDGLAGDRRFGLFEPGTDKAVWGGSHPKMMAWEAAHPAQCSNADSAAGDPVFYEPGGAAWGLDEPGLPARLAETIGADKGVEIRKTDGRGGRMLVVFEASLRRLAEQLGREIETARFRPNVVVAADLEPFAEYRIAPGTTIRLGDNDFTLHKPCERCVLPSWSPDGSNERDMELHRHIIKELDNHFGIYVTTAGRAVVKVGDPVSG